MASSEQPCLLLDVNALMALAWPNHQHHGAVVARLDRRLAPPAGRRRGHRSGHALRAFYSGRVKT